MIVEHAVLEVAPDRVASFESAFARARPLIAASPGFLGLRLGRCVEQTGRYLLLVEWERLEDHTERFRNSPAYQEWRSLLHHFYEPFPVVEHYHEIDLETS